MTSPATHTRSKPRIAILQACSGLIVVSFVVEVLADDQVCIRLLRVVPSHYDGSLNLGKPVRPTPEEHVSIVKAIAGQMFGEQLEAGGAR